MPSPLRQKISVEGLEKIFLTLTDYDTKYTLTQLEIERLIDTSKPITLDDLIKLNVSKENLNLIREIKSICIKYAFNETEDDILPFILKLN